MTGYLLVAVGMKEFRLSAGVIYWLLFGMVMVSFLYLLQLFLTDQFQYSYVTSYSSSDLPNQWPHFYKISALWGGQQGTFLMWLVFGLVLGFWVKSKAGENEGWVMFFYILGQTFLLVLTMVSDPFARLNFIPADGQGLNPLLQNYWMQIHPPIVFIGFAATCIPFAFAMAALATNKYDNWVKQTMPWTVFSVVTLGLGIFLGGYWAYETLGWGGYWAWDPVENSSLIPWLAGIALLHGMVVEKSRGTWRRTNIFLAITMFLLIVYGTFLTRSGVLADFSVHSFVDLGYNNLLWASIIVMGITSYGLWIYRAWKMKVPSSSGTEILSQEFSTFLAMILLLPFTLLVLIWTSFPLITSIMSNIPFLSSIAPVPAAIDTVNYNMMGIVFAIIFAIVLGFNALLGWRTTDVSSLKRKLILPTAVSLVISVIFIVFGFEKIALFWSPKGSGIITGRVILMEILYFLFFFAAFFSVVTNLIFLVKRWKVSFIMSGAYITHFGFSMMLIGFIFSSTFGGRQKLTIPENGVASALGFDIKFTGTEKTLPKEDRSYFELVSGNDTVFAYSTAKQMVRGNQIQYARTPHIKKFALMDLYLSVENLMERSSSDIQPFFIRKGETVNFMGSKFLFEGYDSDKNALKLSKNQPEYFEAIKGKSFDLGQRKITFIGYQMGEHEGSMAGKVGAKLSVSYKGKETEVIPTFQFTANGPEGDNVSIPGGGTLTIAKINADVGSVILVYSPGGKVPDLEVGAKLAIISGPDTIRITPKYNAVNPASAASTVALSNGGHIDLLDLNTRENVAQIMFHPPTMPALASIEISTKPMINLVWIGFLLIVAGSLVAVFRRMAEAKDRNG